MHPLDNPAWSALTTHKSAVALVEGMARRFPPEMAVHGALALPMPDAWQSMARLARVPVGLFSSRPLALPTGWTVTRHVELVEMVQDDNSLVKRDREIEIIELKEADAPEMSLLYEATRPARKMCPRNQKLGLFLGVRWDGKLVAMAGLRMHLPGFREITTVGTYPGYEHRGYEGPDPTFLSVRRDKEVQLGGGVIQQLSPTLSATASVQWIDNNSSLPVYGYRRTLGAVSLPKTF